MTHVVAMDKIVFAFSSPLTSADTVELGSEMHAHMRAHGDGEARGTGHGTAPRWQPSRHAALLIAVPTSPVFLYVCVHVCVQA